MPRAVSCAMPLLFVWSTGRAVCHAFAVCWTAGRACGCHHRRRPVPYLWLGCYCPRACVVPCLIPWPMLSSLFAGTVSSLSVRRVPGASGGVATGDSSSTAAAPSAGGGSASGSGVDLRPAWMRARDGDLGPKPGKPLEGDGSAAAEKMMASWGYREGSGAWSPLPHGCAASV